MAETVFWDTAAFVALGNARDEHHDEAMQIREALGKQKAHLLTTSAVLIEVANTFSKAPWRAVARQLIEATRQSAAAELATIVHVEPSLWQRGWALFLARSDKDWTLTDCISFIVMQDLGVPRAFTSDHHFEQAGFKRLMQG